MNVEIQADDDAYALAVVEEMRRSAAIVPPKLRDEFRARYVFALAIIALFTVAAGLSGMRLIDNQASAAAEINIAGRQRMLSQRIALYASLHQLASARNRPALADTLRGDVDLMRRSQAALLGEDRTLGLTSDPSGRVRSMFDAGVRSDVDEFLALAEASVDPEASVSARVDAARVVQATASGPLLFRLDDIVTAYQFESDRQVDRIQTEQRVVLVATLLALLLEALFVFRPMSRRISMEKARLDDAAVRHQAEAARHSFGLQLRDALDLCETEDDLVTTMEQAKAISSVPGTMELLLTDAASLDEIGTRSPTTHSCSVPHVDACPAMRTGHTRSFPDSETLGSCKYLRLDARANGDPASATCMPVTFLGNRVGVLRTVTDAGRSLADDEMENLATMANAAGTHVGTMRAFAKSQRDAERDALTGLLNRRGLISTVAELERSDQAYIVVVADLDHFKTINDTHGHDAGDVALIEAAQIMSSVLRPDDIIARQGGEEFVIIVPIMGEASTPGRELTAGISVAERIRAAMETNHEMSSSPSCTVSLGVAGPAIHGLQSTLRSADAALYRAKQLGRNRFEVEGSVATEPADVEPTPAETAEVGPDTLERVTETVG